MRASRHVACELVLAAGEQEDCQYISAFTNPPGRRCNHQRCEALGPDEVLAHRKPLLSPAVPGVSGSTAGAAQAVHGSRSFS